MRKLLAITLILESKYMAKAQDHLRQGFEDKTIISADVVSTDDLPGYTSQAQADHIKTLPGMVTSFASNQFSGYLGGGNGREIFYWYVESEGNVDEDPVMFWTNGGPGCSGLMGFGTEFGPFLFPNTTTVEPNPNTWNKVSSILYVEQPAGVGFSYCENSEDCHNVTDKQAAEASYNVILEFLKRFPERKKNDFFIASESFGGHYIPHLTTTILDKNLENDINFKGFLVGNPYVDDKSNDDAQFAAMYAHGLIALPLYQELKRSCSIPEGDVKSCKNSKQFIFHSMNGINQYALDYPVCLEGRSEPNLLLPRLNWNFHKYSLSEQAKHMISRIHRVHFENKFGNDPRFLPAEEQYDPCKDRHFKQFLDNKDVRTALHIREEYAPKNWTICAPDKKFTFNEADNLKSQIYLYKDIIQRAKTSHKNLKMMVYSGDDDSVCALQGTQYWIYDIGAKTVNDELWMPWKVNGEIAGYLTNFDLGENTNSSFKLVTVHGAGHEVPSYRPVEALVMLRSFFSNSWPVK